MAHHQKGVIRMPNSKTYYVLEYEEPFEFDDDDSGDPSHDVAWDIKRIKSGDVLEIPDDERDNQALHDAEVFLQEGGISVEGITYNRRGINLTFYREVKVW